MDNKMFIAQIYISPVKLGNGNAKFTMGIPATWCVIDPINKIAIDIKNELQYKYIETCNFQHFLNNSFSLLEDNKRVAIFPLMTITIPTEILKHGQKIIGKINDNKKFLDGNEVISNELYLKIIENSYIEEEQTFDSKKVNKQMRKVLKKGK